MTPDAPQTPVLIADDEEQLLRLCGRVLGRRGYEVLTARDGDEAVRVFSERRGDVRAVVLDAGIPPGGAAAACREMLKASLDLGVVFISGAELDPGQRALLNAHGGIFLRKPFAAAALVRAVEDAQQQAGA